ncbi:MAG: biotin/lipoate A/B protein ligase family protein [Bacillus sp. (in: firmicutes)]
MKSEPFVWGFIDSGANSPGFNMAMDEKLLQWHSEGSIPPIVRFYGWEPATLSIGYFQRARQEIDLKKVKEAGVGFVRRATGGRAVLHEHELTYSVIVSESYEGMPYSVTEAYRVISEGILRGFRHLGLQAQFAVPDSDEAIDRIKKPKSAICFDTPSWYELVVEGKKIAGSAQVRQSGVILQHGAILLKLDREKLFSFFTFDEGTNKDKLLKTFHEKAVSLYDLTGKETNMEDVKDAFKRGFAEGLSVDFDTFSLTEEQLEEIKRLSRDKYQSDEWNYMR